MMKKMTEEKNRRKMVVYVCLNGLYNFYADIITVRKFIDGSRSAEGQKAIIVYCEQSWIIIDSNLAAYEITRDRVNAAVLW